MSEPKESFLREIESEFEGARFSDKRLEARLVKVATAMSLAPDKSFPKALSGAAALEGAYRLFGNSSVEPSDVLDPHIRRTLARVNEQDLVLVAHDSSTVSFGSEGYREGLGETTGYKQSFLLHCSLALRADGSRQPEGVLAASYHIPTEAKNGALQKRWIGHVHDIHGLGIEPHRVVHLKDCECDDYATIEKLCGMGARFVIRAHHNRRLKEGRLRDLALAATLHTRREVPLSRRVSRGGTKQRKTHPPRQARTAQLAISSTSVSIPKTPNGRTTTELSLNLVRVWEPDPPEGQKAIEWLLYTSEPIDSAECVLQIVDWYRARWSIEEYFKALKQGCALEKRQLGDFHALANATALFLPIAWKLLLLKTTDASRPHDPASTVLDVDELEVLHRITRIQLPPEPTIRQAMNAIAALGGHLKHNGTPGWQTLARGYQHLSTVLVGYRLHSRSELPSSNLEPPSPP